MYEWCDHAYRNDHLSDCAGTAYRNDSPPILRQIAAGKTALRIICAGFLVSSVSVTSCGALEGLGRGSASLVVSLCRYLIIILPAAFILSHFFGAVGVWNAFWIAEALTTAVSFMISRKVIGNRGVAPKPPVEGVSLSEVYLFFMFLLIPFEHSLIRVHHFSLFH